MGGREKKIRAEARSAPSPELKLKARAVSRGVAIGKVVWLHGNRLQFYKIDLQPSEVGREKVRLKKAVDVARLQLKRLAANDAKIAKSGPGIFQTHLDLIGDSSLLSKFENEIETQRVNAEWAIKHVSDIYVSKYKGIEDETLRDRYIDIEDVSERILAAMEGNSAATLPFAKDSIIAARELKPSTLIELARDSPRAIITENGGWTSHTFIIAREMKLPAVTGLKKIFRRVRTGDSVIVDGYTGQVIVHPDGETVRQYRSDIRADGIDEIVRTDRERYAKTLDGLAVRIFANCDTPDSYRKAAAQGAAGIGLFRSEFLFDQNRGFPTESKQKDAYKAMSAAAGDERVKIRTFDLGAERLVDQGPAREKNPALGLRAVRLALTFKKIMRTQLRAIARAAAAKNNIDVVIPMVSGMSELREVREILEEEVRGLTAKGKPSALPGIGVMIEVPSAVLMIKEILSECDFVCLGTNDLIQYLLAADRDNEAIAGWYRTLHPAVLRAVGQVISAARAAGKSAVICGEMAGSPFYIPVLLGLGATELSMNPNSIGRSRTFINGIAAEECRKLVQVLGEARTVEEVEEIAAGHIRTNWAHLFPRDFSFS